MELEVFASIAAINIDAATDIATIDMYIAIDDDAKAIATINVDIATIAMKL